MAKRGDGDGGDADDGGLEASQLLNLAETHLRLRNFSLSRQYSLELLSASSTHRRHRAAATQILTISDVLSAVSSNPYSILLIDSFSDDHHLIRAQSKKLLFILQPATHHHPLAKLAVDLVQRAFNCLSDPSKKSAIDSELKRSMDDAAAAAAAGSATSSSGGGGFWTFCPYCFYVYEYDRVYEGCCLRCQNSGCRRVFHGVALTSLPKMELDKGRYFGCFGYFPMGFGVGEDSASEMGKFASWSPIVGMFPAASKSDLNRHVSAHSTAAFDDDVVEISDESNESDSGANVGGGGVPIVDSNRPGFGGGMRRKSVARRKKRSSEGGNGSGERLFSDEDGENLVHEFGLGSDHGKVGTVCDLNEGDVAFFEGDGEIFVGLGGGGGGGGSSNDAV